METQEKRLTTSSCGYPALRAHRSRAQIPLKAVVPRGGASFAPDYPPPGHVPASWARRHVPRPGRPASGPSRAVPPSRVVCRRTRPRSAALGARCTPISPWAEGWDHLPVRPAPCLRLVTRPKGPRTTILGHFPACLLGNPYDTQKPPQGGRNILEYEFQVLGAWWPRGSFAVGIRRLIIVLRDLHAGARRADGADAQALRRNAGPQGLQLARGHGGPAHA